MIDAAVAVRKIVTALVLPPAGPLLLMMVGLLFCRRWHVARWLAWLGLGLAWLLATPAIGTGLAQTLEQGQVSLEPAMIAAAMAGTDPPRAVVVLGGGAGRDARERPTPDVLGLASLRRLMYGVQLAREHRLPLLVSGGAPYTDVIPEAQIMARVARDTMGLAPTWVEDRSLDTPGNARESARLLSAAGVGSVILVTTATHMRRAQARFEQAGLKVLPAPTGFSGTDVGNDPVLDWLPGVDGARLTRLALHEWMGLAWYRLGGGR